jgi:hypothetical protein
MKVLLVERRVSVVDLPLKEAIKVMDAQEFIKSLPIFGEESSGKEELGRIKEL